MPEASEATARIVQSELPSYFGEKNELTQTLSIMERMAQLAQKPWVHGQYKKENWGNRLHSIAPYIGRIKPAFAHWLIRIFTKPGDVVLDPFCGIGTIPLECDLLGRKAIGIDLNPYAVAIAKAKFDRRPLGENIRWLQTVELKLGDTNLDSISGFVKKFYHRKTLLEILALKEEILKAKREFLLGCLLGISHGHRPQYLSAWTGYIIPFEPKTKAEYRPVIPRMISKVRRIYKDRFPLSTQGRILQADTRKIPLPANSVNAIITSPPYFDTIDYIGANRLRLALMGFSDDEIEQWKGSLIQREDTYLHEMEKVGKELLRVMKDESLCVFVLGDLHKRESSRNTAQEVSELYRTLGFRIIGVVEDEIPLARRTALKWDGMAGLAKRKRKFDRILVMEK